MSDKKYQPITVRPPQVLRPGLEDFASDLGKSEGQLLSDLLADCLEMLEKNADFVPKAIRAVRAMRAYNATYTDVHHAIGIRRDRREAAFYQDIQAGRTAGVCSDNPPEKITIPSDFPHHVDFAVRVCGDSMEPMIHEGEIGAFRQTETPQDGRIVAALVEGQTVMKLFKGPNGSPAQLVSLNPKYPPIPCTAETRIQGIYEGKLRAEDIPELAIKKAAGRRGKKQEPAPF